MSDGYFFANKPGSFDAMELRKKIAVAKMMQNRGYPKNVGEGLFSAGSDIMDAMQMRSLEKYMSEEEKRVNAKLEDNARKNGAPIVNADDMPDDEFNARFGRPGAEFVAPRPVQQAAEQIEPPLDTPPPLPLEQQARVRINTAPAPPPAPTEAPLATVQPRSLQPPPGPAALAQSMSPSQNPLMNQYPVESGPSPFPGPDVASQQVPQSIAMRQPMQAPPPGNAQGLPPPWLGQTVADAQRMTGPQPIGGSPGPTGMPQPGQQAMAPPLDARDDIAMQLASRGPGGPPPNPMMGGQAPASMPQNLMNGGGLSTPPNLALAGSPPEAASNRPITMRDIEPGPRPVPGAQLAQAVSPPPAVRPPPASPAPGAILGPGDRPTPPPARPDLGRQPIGVPVEQGFEKSKYFEPAPTLAPPNQWLRDTQLAHDKARNPVEREGYRLQIERENKRREDELKAATEAWTNRSTVKRQQYEKDLERRTNPAKTEADARAAEYDTNKRAMEARELERFGPGGREPHFKALQEARKEVNAIAPMMRTLNQVDKTLADNSMFTGAGANINTVRGKIIHLLGWPLDPKVPDTERFVSQLAPMVAQARREVSGNANISNADVALSLRNAMADPTLERDTLIKSFAEIRQAAVLKAVEHQRAVRNYSTGDTPEQERQNFNTLGVPGYKDIIPREAIAELRADPSSAAEFDDTFHWPGLAKQILGGR